MIRKHNLAWLGGNRPPLPQFGVRPLQGILRGRPRDMRMEPLAMPTVYKTDSSQLRGVHPVWGLEALAAREYILAEESGSDDWYEMVDKLSTTSHLGETYGYWLRDYRFNQLLSEYTKQEEGNNFIWRACLGGIDTTLTRCLTEARVDLATLLDQAPSQSEAPIRQEQADRMAYAEGINNLRDRRPS